VVDRYHHRGHLSVVAPDRYLAGQEVRRDRAGYFLPPGNLTGELTRDLGRAGAAFTVMADSAQDRSDDQAARADEDGHPSCDDKAVIEVDVRGVPEELYC
jgi:hypothetical protein